MPVTILKCNTYDLPLLTSVVRQSLDLLGGLSRFVRSGDTVLIKPNLLGIHPPEAAVTTHPALVRAVVELVQEVGGQPIIGDSPGGNPAVFRNYDQLLQITGIKKVVKETGAKVVDFAQEGTVAVDNPLARVCTKLYIAKPVLDADIIISVPKLKTHALTIYTGAVKNLLGCLPGLNKAEFHRTASKVADFGQALIDLLLIVKPQLSIMDAVVGMEGNGPTSGKPRRIGLILASDDPVSLDVTACDIIGLDPFSICTNRAAAERGLGSGGLENITVLGETIENTRLENFLLPLTAFNNESYVSEYVSLRPVIEAERCTLCLLCQKSCPVQAIALSNEELAIDYERCIKCLCCHELCPQKAVELKLPQQSLFQRAMSQVNKISKQMLSIGDAF